MTLTLTLREPPPERVDASAISPERMRDATAREAASVTLRCGEAPVELGELFAVAGTGSADLFVIGDLRRFDGLGGGMRGGRLTLSGSCGDRVGVGMSGGEIVVIGDVGARAGSEMCGGNLSIRGNAGERLGSGLPGAHMDVPRSALPGAHMGGMTGGEIVISGDAGNAAGAGIRRGLVAIGGRAGTGAARRMLGGTVIALGGFGVEVGVGNRAGTIVSGAPVELLDGYRFATRYRPPALALQLRELRRRFLPIDEAVLGGAWARWVGDARQHGQGEIFVYEPAASREASSTSIRTP